MKCDCLSISAFVEGLHYLFWQAGVGYRGTRFFGRCDSDSVADLYLAYYSMPAWVSTPWDTFPANAAALNHRFFSPLRLRPKPAILLHSKRGRRVPSQSFGVHVQ